jgi:pimeloyl-ACP methyl ester carboxylesterase
VPTPADEHALLALDGGCVEYLDLEGDPERAGIVLLHEGLGSVRLWRGFPRRLAEATGRRVIVFSRHGHGRSDPPPRPRTIEFMGTEALAVLPSLLEELGSPAPILIGHSDGASIALIHAASHAVTGLVLLAPHVFVEEATLEGIRAARRAFDSGDLAARMASHHREPAVTFDGWCNVWLDPRFRSWNIEGLLESVVAPALLIQGTQDEYGTLDQLDAIDRGLRGSTQRLLVAGGHAPHLAAPDQVIAAIRDFVAPLA